MQDNVQNSDEIFGKTILRYTRAQAIADGTLVDVSAMAREAGFRIPVAVTSAVWTDCVAWTDADSERQTVAKQGWYCHGLIRLGFWTADNPLARLRQFKVAERKLSFLDDDEIRALLAALEARKERDALLITKLCLASAARWNEAESLRISQLHSGMVHFTQTKTDKNRSIPIARLTGG